MCCGARDSEWEQRRTLLLLGLIQLEWFVAPGVVIVAAAVAEVAAAAADVGSCRNSTPKAVYVMKKRPYTIPWLSS